MKLLIKQAVIADPRSEWNGKAADLIIENGTISAIGQNLEASGAETIIQEGLHVSPGFTDIFGQLGDPGLEYKETLESGAAAAAAGGYTRIFITPNTQPALHSKAQVEYVVQKSKALPVQVLPLAAISKNCEGKDLTEMYDMHNSGAVAFSDGTAPMQSSQVLLKALLYVKAIDGVIIQLPDELSLSKTGLANEGLVSTRLGLPGKPALAEHLMISRDIELVRYTGSKLHITGISTATSVELIRKAKADGLQVSCSVTPYHLNFCDEDLHTYDTNLKVNPPLRTSADVAALKAAVLDGTIDCIASHHIPQEYDSKVCEFEYAKYGMEGYESSFGAVAAAIPELTTAQLVQLFALAPAQIFGLQTPTIAAGATASLTLFVPDASEIFTKEKIRSANSNNAFIGKTLKGKITGIINNQTFINNNIS